jgi:hypothetical protein
MKRRFANLCAAAAALVLFSSGFAPPAGAATCLPLARNSGVLVGGYVADQYVWYDSLCRQRSAALVPDDGYGKGGHAKQFTYTLPDGTERVVGESGDHGFAGFGYIVSHLQNAGLVNKDGPTDNCHVPDDSPLGSDCEANSRTVFLGRHHAIHEFTLNYPRWGSDPVTGVATRYDVPVTIHWFFATGRDHPVWAVTFDLSNAPANAIVADTRAPYGDMNFDGAPVGSWSDKIGGVAWGDKYQFSSAGNGLTMNSSWDWSNLNNLAPYNYLWTANADAEMGIVGTRVIGKQDAGGYQGLLGRGKTSQNYSCTAEGHTMPCMSVWPFQSVNYSFYDQNGNLLTDALTPAKRLAWGADWGYLGQETITTINEATVQGWPKVSYSTYITLGRHSDQPSYGAGVEARVRDNTRLGAHVSGIPLPFGMVPASGPAGPGRSDQMIYSPAGFNPVYGTWDVFAVANRATLDFTIQDVVPQLTNPVIVLHNYLWNGPPRIKLRTPFPVPFEQLLVNDRDYFVSYRDDALELWITLNRSMYFNGTVTIN